METIVAAEGTGRVPGGVTRSRRRRSTVPATVIVRIDLAALRRGRAQGGEWCEIDGLGPIPVETARELMDDAFIAAVLTDGTDIRSVLHLGRRPTAEQRTALLARDPVCAIPGCGSRDRLETDHVEDWSTTRVTRLDALARLCHHHHRQKTVGDWTLEGRPGAWTWRSRAPRRRSGSQASQRGSAGTDPSTPVR